MKIVVISAVALGLVLTAAAQTESLSRVRVLKNNCNLRAAALATAEVAGQVSENEVLLAKTMGEEWVEVIPPSHVDFWVLGDYVKEGRIDSRQKVNVRAGPGINFSIVGQLPAGEKVDVRGSRAGWMKIAPPSSCSLWIARSLVSDVPAAEIEPAKVVLAEADEEATAVLPPAVVTTSALPVQVESKPPPPPKKPRVAPQPQTAFALPPPGLDLASITGQGQWREVEGILQRKNFFVRSPGDCRLVTIAENGGKKETICYVKGNRAQLKALLYRRLVISGRQYWVKRQKVPVIVPEYIVLK